MRVEAGEPAGRAVRPDTDVECEGLRTRLAAAELVGDERERAPPARLLEAQASSAALARAAICEKPAGSLTARSASTFRSSPISAFRQPETNWL